MNVNTPKKQMVPPPQDWAGVAQPHIDYVVKIAINDDETKIKIVGKRYSDLADLHKLLHERKLVNPKTAPAFPDKNNLHQQWWKLNDKDPESEFVKQRKAALGTYIDKLFDTHPGLAFHPLVMAFFQMEELGMEAALLTSVKTAEFDKRHGIGAEAEVGPNSAFVAPSLGANGASSVATGGGYINPEVRSPMAKRNETTYDV